MFTIIIFQIFSQNKPAAMADISKEDLKKEIQDILKDADLDNTSAKKVFLSIKKKKKLAFSIFR